MKERGTVVLVTGAAGFLGQHVVKMLQTRADHVREIRAFDVAPFVKQLDYKQEKPINATVDSITDVEILYKACQGVDCVMHLASLVDISMFQDERRSYKVNVEGTRYVIAACRKCNVPRLIYCSSYVVVVGKDHLYNATENNTSTPDPLLYKVYGDTKKLAEDLVIQANSKDLSTISLRPVGMYGDIERKITPIMAKSNLCRKTGYVLTLACKTRTDHCYVGNCAWAFVCADLALQGSKSQSVTGNVYLETEFHCSYDKAKSLLDYHPLFDFEEAKRLTALYILKLKNENT